jgi:hypothetical protein
MKKHLLFLILLSTSLLPAQDKKIQYGGLQQLGLEVGASRSYINFTLINGIRFHRFFTGIGASIRSAGTNYMYSYPHRTATLFLDGRYYLNRKKNFFALVNGGLNVILNQTEDSEYYTYKNFPGYYGGLGLGFKARLGKEAFYSFDLSYCQRQTRYHYAYRNTWISEQWFTEKYDIRQPVLLVRIGIEIF